MPIYEYVCQGCGNRFDKILPISLFELTTYVCCPVCFTDSERVMSAPALIFVGKGRDAYLPNAIPDKLLRKSDPPQERHRPKLPKGAIKWSGAKES